MNTKTKRIIAITTISLGTLGFANAQVPTSTTTPLSWSQKTLQGLTHKNNKDGKMGMRHGMMKGGMGKMGGDRKLIHDAIAAGNFSEFQKVASTSPLAKIDQNTFNSLVPHFQAIKNARTNIESILKAAGVAMPEKPTK